MKRYARCWVVKCLALSQIKVAQDIKDGEYDTKSHMRRLLDDSLEFGAAGLWSSWNLLLLSFAKWLVHINVIGKLKHLLKAASLHPTY